MISFAKSYPESVRPFKVARNVDSEDSRKLLGLNKLHVFSCNDETDAKILTRMALHHVVVSHSQKTAWVSWLTMRRG